MNETKLKALRYVGWSYTRNFQTRCLFIVGMIKKIRLITAYHFSNWWESVMDEVVDAGHNYVSDNYHFGITKEMRTRMDAVSDIPRQVPYYAPKIYKVINSDGKDITEREIMDGNLDPEAAASNLKFIANQTRSERKYHNKMIKLGLTKVGNYYV